MALAARAAIAARARADDQDRPVAAVEGAEPGGMGVRVDLEAMRRDGRATGDARPQRSARRRRHPCPHGSARDRCSCKPCLGERFAAGGEKRVPDQIGIEADIGRPARAFSQQPAFGIAQARPALGAAAINAKEQGSVISGTDLAGAHYGQAPCHLISSSGRGVGRRIPRCLGGRAPRAGWQERKKLQTRRLQIFLRRRQRRVVFEFCRYQYEVTCPERFPVEQSVRPLRRAQECSRSGTGQ